MSLQARFRTWDTQKQPKYFANVQVRLPEFVGGALQLKASRSRLILGSAALLASTQLRSYFPREPTKRIN